MIATGSFLTAAALILLLAPLVLTAGRWQVHHPRTALSLWFSALFAGIGCAVASATTALMCCVEVGEAHAPAEGILLTIAGWLSLGVLAAVIAFAILRTGPLFPTFAFAVAAVVWCFTEFKLSEEVIYRASTRNDIRFAREIIGYSSRGIQDLTSARANDDLSLMLTSCLFDAFNLRI